MSMSKRRWVLNTDDERWKFSKIFIIAEIIRCNTINIISKFSVKF